MQIEFKNSNPLQVGNIIYPEILVNGKYAKVFPIGIYSNSDYKSFYAVARKTRLQAADYDNYRPFDSNVWVGYWGTQSNIRGIKIFLPPTFEPPHEGTAFHLSIYQALRITKVFSRSAQAEIIDIKINRIVLDQTNFTDSLLCSGEGN